MDPNGKRHCSSTSVDKESLHDWRISCNYQSIINKIELGSTIGNNASIVASFDPSVPPDHPDYTPQKNGMEKRRKTQTDQEKGGLIKMEEYGFLRLICMVEKVGQCNTQEGTTVMHILEERCEIIFSENSR